MIISCSIVGFLLAHTALAKEVSGFNIAESLPVEGKTLVLNGTGIRSKFGFKVYVGALYVAQKSKQPEALLSSSGPAYVKLHFLRDVDKEKMTSAWMDGYNNNCASLCAAHKKDLDALNALTFDMKKTETMGFLLTSEKVELYKNDGKVGTILAKDFYKTVLPIFIGEKPADKNLRDGLLGK